MEPGSAGVAARERDGEGRAGPEGRGRSGRRLGLALWGLAVVVMLAAAVYQRRTGPTHPLAGTVEIDGRTLEYELVRSGSSTEDALVHIADPGAGVDASLLWRRYPTGEPFARVPFEPLDGRLAAPLDRQPAAGKLEYFIELRHGDDPAVTIPAGSGPRTGADNVLIRFKDPVPAAALVPHVALMILALLVGVRAGLGALAGTADARRWAWTTLALLTAGGMILGPVVQKHAFGAFWTGFPFGYDLTDNKTLLMWLGWLLACGVIGTRQRSGRRDGVGRLAVALAALVMLTVYLIPHSLRGSQLDYDALEQGTDPARAVRTG